MLSIGETTFESEAAGITINAGDSTIVNGEDVVIRAEAAIEFNSIHNNIEFVAQEEDGNTTIEGENVKFDSLQEVEVGFGGGFEVNVSEDLNFSADRVLMDAGLISFETTHFQADIFLNAQGQVRAESAGDIAIEGDHVYFTASDKVLFAAGEMEIDADEIDWEQLHFTMKAQDSMSFYVDNTIFLFNASNGIFMKSDGDLSFFPENDDPGSSIFFDMDANDYDSVEEISFYAEEDVVINTSTINFTGNAGREVYFESDKLVNVLATTINFESTTRTDIDFEGGLGVSGDNIDFDASKGLVFDAQGQMDFVASDDVNVLGFNNGVFDATRKLFIDVANTMQLKTHDDVIFDLGGDSNFVTPLLTLNYNFPDGYTLLSSTESTGDDYINLEFTTLIEHEANEVNVNGENTMFNGNNMIFNADNINGNAENMLWVNAGNDININLNEINIDSQNTILNSELGRIDAPNFLFNSVNSINFNGEVDFNIQDNFYIFSNEVNILARTGRDDRVFFDVSNGMVLSSQNNTLTGGEINFSTAKFDIRNMRHMQAYSSNNNDINVDIGENLNIGVNNFLLETDWLNWDSVDTIDFQENGNQPSEFSMTGQTHHIYGTDIVHDVDNAVGDFTIDSGESVYMGALDSFKYNADSFTLDGNDIIMHGSSDITFESFLEEHSVSIGDDLIFNSYEGKVRFLYQSPEVENRYEVSSKNFFVSIENGKDANIIAPTNLNMHTSSFMAKTIQGDINNYASEDIRYDTQSTFIKGGDYVINAGRDVRLWIAEDPGDLSFVSSSEEENGNINDYDISFSSGNTHFMDSSYITMIANDEHNEDNDYSIDIRSKSGGINFEHQVGNMFIDIDNSMSFSAQNAYTASSSTNIDMYSNGAASFTSYSVCNGNCGIQFDSLDFNLLADGSIIHLAGDDIVFNSGDSLSITANTNTHISAQNIYSTTVSTTYLTTANDMYHEVSGGNYNLNAIQSVTYSATDSIYVHTASEDTTESDIVFTIFPTGAEVEGADSLITSDIIEYYPTGSFLINTDSTYSMTATNLQYTAGDSATLSAGGNTSDFSATGAFTIEANGVNGAVEFTLSNVVMTGDSYEFKSQETFEGFSGVSVHISGTNSDITTDGDTNGIYFSGNNLLVTSELQSPNPTLVVNSHNIHFNGDQTIEIDPSDHISFGNPNSNKNNPQIIMNTDSINFQSDGPIIYNTKTTFSTEAELITVTSDTTMSMTSNAELYFEANGNNQNSQGIVRIESLTLTNIDANLAVEIDSDNTLSSTFTDTISIFSTGSQVNNYMLIDSNNHIDFNAAVNFDVTVDNTAIFNVGALTTSSLDTTSILANDNSNTGQINVISDDLLFITTTNGDFTLQTDQKRGRITINTQDEDSDISFISSENIQVSSGNSIEIESKSVYSETLNDITFTTTSNSKGSIDAFATSDIRFSNKDIGLGDTTTFSITNGNLFIDSDGDYQATTTFFNVLGDDITIQNEKGEGGNIVFDEYNSLKIDSSKITFDADNNLVFGHDYNDDTPAALTSSSSMSFTSVQDFDVTVEGFLDMLTEQLLIENNRDGSIDFNAEDAKVFFKSFNEYDSSSFTQSNIDFLSQGSASLTASNAINIQSSNTEDNPSHGINFQSFNDLSIDAEAASIVVNAFEELIFSTLSTAGGEGAISFQSSGLSSSQDNLNSHPNFINNLDDVGIQMNSYSEGGTVFFQSDSGFRANSLTGNISYFAFGEDPQTGYVQMSNPSADYPVVFSANDIIVSSTGNTEFLTSRLTLSNENVALTSTGGVSFNCNQESATNSLNFNSDASINVRTSDNNDGVIVVKSTESIVSITSSFRTIIENENQGIHILADGPITMNAAVDSYFDALDPIRLHSYGDIFQFAQDRVSFGVLSSHPMTFTAGANVVDDDQSGMDFFASGDAIFQSSGDITFEARDGPMDINVNGLSVNSQDIIIESSRDISFQASNIFINTLSDTEFGFIDDDEFTTYIGIDADSIDFRSTSSIQVYSEVFTTGSIPCTNEREMFLATTGVDYKLCVCDKGISTCTTDCDNDDFFLTFNGPVSASNNVFITMTIGSVGDQYIISNLDVTVNISNLLGNIYLVSPKGTMILLGSNFGAPCSFATTLDDSATGTNICNGGTQRPIDRLSMFEGEELDGQWSLWSDSSFTLNSISFNPRCSNTPLHLSYNQYHQYF
eukprot:TRINITY_DN2372_c0_g1_i2.p1 TRINITY_DN2372_c0_g1~~TRINITY_DN2372_c0_g1_i2.p1  ORF type:complete len:2183 (-),score=800.52 TRINITY_DN2372_c0_g1_i2:110-6658(-)